MYLGAGQRDKGVAAEALRAHILIRKQEAESCWEQSFEISKPTPKDTSPPKKPHLHTLPNGSTNWGPSVQTHELWRPFLFINPDALEQKL